MGVRNQSWTGLGKPARTGARLARRVLPALALTLLLAVGPGGEARAGVDANTATAAELDAISGIGPALAERIVQERRNSPFRSLDDLQSRVRGVGEANLRRMREGGLTVGPGLGAGGTPTIVGGMEPARRGREARRVPRAAVK